MRKGDVSRSSVNMLIDYDNVGKIRKKRGVRHIVETILSRLPASLLPAAAAVSVRLYGGWFQGRKPSPAARRLYREIALNFPALIAPQNDVIVHPVRTTVSLARSLSISPKKILTHTFRVRNAPSNLNPRRFPFSGCTHAAACPLSGTYHLLRNQKCPQTHCAVGIDDTMTRPEQKMVDSMLIVDMIHAALQGTGDIVIVTADDDFIPGINMALFLGTVVHHVRTDGRRRADSNSTIAGSNYKLYSI